MKTPKTKDNKVAYQTMAVFYDEMMGNHKYPGWKVLISDVIKKYKISTGKCLDIACGTGNISKLLVDLGFSVVGVDMSSEMVKIARKKLPKETFICSDIRDLKLKESTKKEVTLAVSFYDSLNYLLTDDDILKAFKAIRHNIPKGTIFLFDMNTMEHVEAAQKFKPWTLETNDFYSIYRFGGEERFWVLDIDIFIKEGNKYRLVREKHTERGYDEKHISPLLRQAGFELLEIKGDYQTYDGVNHLTRQYFISRKI